MSKLRTNVNIEKFEWSQTNTCHILGGTPVSIVSFRVTYSDGYVLEGKNLEGRVKLIPPKSEREEVY